LEAVKRRVKMSLSDKMDDWLLTSRDSPTYEGQNLFISMIASYPLLALFSLDYFVYLNEIEFKLKYRVLLEWSRTIRMNQELVLAAGWLAPCLNFVCS
jgi:hypothetical protein